jgi:hypothetical protein
MTTIHVPFQIHLILISLEEIKQERISLCSDMPFRLPLFLCITLHMQCLPEDMRGQRKLAGVDNINSWSVMEEIVVV